MIIGRRRSRVVGAIWALVGVALVAAAVLLWLDEARVSFELPAALVALVLAWSWWRQHAVLDRHGIATVGAVGERRLLWASVDRVEVRRRAWFRPSIVLHPKGGAAAIPVPASAGLRRRQRNRLLEFLTDIARQHGFDLVAATGEPLARPGAAMDDVRDRVLAGALGGPTFGSAPAASATASVFGDDALRPAPLDSVEAGPAEPATASDGQHPRMPSWLRDAPRDDASLDSRATDAPGAPDDDAAPDGGATEGPDAPDAPEEPTVATVDRGDDPGLVDATTDGRPAASSAEPALPAAESATVSEVGSDGVRTSDTARPLREGN